MSLLQKYNPVSQITDAFKPKGFSQDGGGLLQQKSKLSQPVLRFLVHARQAYRHIEAGNHAKARESCLNAVDMLQKHPNLLANAGVNYVMAKLLDFLGLQDFAKEFASKALDIDPSHPGARLMLISVDESINGKNRY